MQSQGKTH
jgi:hypothetical protein